jgi:hypothetical protein
MITFGHYDSYLDQASLHKPILEQRGIWPWLAADELRPDMKHAVVACFMCSKRVSFENGMFRLFRFRQLQRARSQL